MERMVDYADEIAWLTRSPDARPDPAGEDRGGFEASAWLLHAMYTNPELAHLGTHDDVHRAQLASGEIEPLEFNGVSLEIGEVIGNSIDYYSAPGPEWKRTYWRDYLDSPFPPKTMWMPGPVWFPGRRSFPASVIPPGEGALDYWTLLALMAAVETLTDDDVETECFASFSMLATRTDEDLIVYRGKVIDIPLLLWAHGGPHDPTPSNIWAADHSWLTYTDCDAWGTKVSGPQALIDILKSITSDAIHEAPEVVSWEPTPELQQQAS